MGNRKQTVLLVSNDAGFCAALRKEFSLTAERVRVTAVSSLDAAHRILEEDAVAGQSGAPRGPVPSLEAVVAPLAIHAPVVVIGSAEKREELSGLIDADAVDFVAREGESLKTALRMMERRLRQARQRAASAAEAFGDEGEDFGEALRHELNNPLTGILGNAELLLAEIHRKNDGQIPQGGRTAAGNCKIEIRKSKLENRSGKRERRLTRSTETGNRNWKTKNGTRSPACGRKLPSFVFSALGPRSRRSLCPAPAPIEDPDPVGTPSGALIPILLPHVLLFVSIFSLYYVLCFQHLSHSSIFRML